MNTGHHIGHVYFLGIGGIGMSALARYYHALGYRVAGYDKTPSPLLDELVAAGIDVTFDEALDAIPADIRAKDTSEVLWVYTPAIPADHAQFRYLKEKGVELVKRAEVLGRITRGRMTLAVAGTHGKTTTSTLLAHLLIQAGIDCTAFLGGISGNYGVNYLQAADVDTAPIVVEADEFDRSFLRLQPNKAIITSVDADHLDIYGEADEFRRGFEAFAAMIPFDGLLIQKEGLNLDTAGISKDYSVGGNGAFRALNVQVKDGAWHFDLRVPGGLFPALSLGLPGRHNMENAVAASAIALSMGVTEEQLRHGLQSFKGVKRRFEYRIKRAGQVFIDDYAHHPEELKACIGSLKELYPDKKICGIFQPHLFTRTRDFMDGFAESLSMLDTCILMEIYPARELPIEGVNSAALLDRITASEKYLMSADEILAWLGSNRPEVVATLGAGDIDRIVPKVEEVLA